MPIEDDYTRTVNNQVLVDVTRNGLGARGIDIIEKTTASGTVTAFPLYDGHGSMVATLSRSGPGFAVNDRRSFDAWGAVRTGNATGDPKGRYCANLGHVQDDESGLVYMRARYCEASTGRFVSEVPARHGLNCFSYCSNDPISFSDSSGLFPWFSFIRLLSGGVGLRSALTLYTACSWPTLQTQFNDASQLRLLVWHSLAEPWLRILTRTKTPPGCSARLLSNEC